MNEPCVREIAKAHWPHGAPPSLLLRRVRVTLLDVGFTDADPRPLDQWARSAPPRDAGVIVTPDGSIVAHTRRRPRAADAWGVLLDGSPVTVALRFAVPGLEAATGAPVAHIAGWEVTT